MTKKTTGSASQPTPPDAADVVIPPPTGTHIDDVVVDPPMIAQLFRASSVDVALLTDGTLCQVLVDTYKQPPQVRLRPCAVTIERRP